MDEVKQDTTANPNPQAPAEDKSKDEGQAAPAPEAGNQEAPTSEDSA